MEEAQFRVAEPRLVGKEALGEMLEALAILGARARALHLEEICQQCHWVRN